jgi:hypothetical protein
MRAGALVLGLALAISSCGGSESSGVEAATPPPDRITGVITELRFEGDALQEFEVETLQDTYSIFIDPERDYGFNLGHLRSHKRGQIPVDVTLEVRGGDLYAVDILDA